MSPRLYPRFMVLVGLVLSACSERSAPLGVDAAPAAPAPDARMPDARVLADAAPPDATPFCGDGVRQPSEECDRQDFGGRSCVDEGYYTGQLACRPECKVEASGCTGRCGDGKINGPELCDDALPLTGTCRSRGFLVGIPVCAAGCALQGCRNFSLPHDEIVLWGRDDTSQLGASMAFAGDVDGDGRADLLAAAPGEVRILGMQGAVYLLAGSANGRATINDAARFVDDSWDNLGSLALEVAPARDLDGDGHADFVIAAHTDARGLDIYLVYGRREPFTGTLKLTDLVERGAAARFSMPPAALAALRPWLPGAPLLAAPSAMLSRRAALGVPDLTGDGRDDLVVTVPGDGDDLSVTYVIPGDRVRYSGTVVLPPPVAPLPPPVHAVVVGTMAGGLLGNDAGAGDLDGDRVADLFVTSGDDVQVFYGPIHGVLSPANAAAHTSLGSITSLAVADLDGDHDAELVVTTRGGGYLFRGGASRRRGPLLADGADLQLGTSGGASVRVGGDVDGDGHPDLVFTGLGILRGPIVQTGFLSLDRSSLRWQPSAPGNTSESPVDVALGDFNGDGFDDVALAVPRTGNGFETDHGVVQILHGATPPAR